MEYLFKKNIFFLLSVTNSIDFRKNCYKMMDKWEKVVKSGNKWV